MNPFVLLAAIFIILVVLVTMFLKLGNKEDNEGSNHFLLQLLVLGFILLFVLLVGKVAVDNDETCAWNVANTTTTANVTVYAHSYDCVPGTKNTTYLFYRTVLWFVRLVALYIVFYFFYEVFMFFDKKKKEKRGQDE